MDLQYLLWAPKQIHTPYSQYLKFNDKDQTIEISPHLPDDHPLQNFIKIEENGKNVFDVDKYFDRVGSFNANIKNNHRNSLFSFSHVYMRLSRRWSQSGQRH